MATAKQIKENARKRFMWAGSLRQRGLTYAEIGKVLGVGTERARQLVLKFERDCTRTARWGGLKPHEYMALKPLQDWLDFLTKESK
jgi:orotate phosphoribosyltransferase-like protein